MTFISRTKISEAEFDGLFSNVKVLRPNERNFIKVALDHENQRIIKVFDLTKKRFLRNKFYSVSKLFIENARHIAKRGVKTIQPSAWYRCYEKKYDAVVYPLLPGESFYELFKKDNDPQLMTKLAQAIADLHARGIYFRAGHPDNILMHDGQYLLIDVDNTRFSVSTRRRAKSLVYVYEHAKRKNQPFFEKLSFDQFLNDYFAVAQLSRFQVRMVRYWVKHYLSKVL